MTAGYFITRHPVSNGQTALERPVLPAAVLRGNGAKSANESEDEQRSK